MEYEYTAKTDQFAVFSEIYYPMEKGWSMTIDGQPATFTKVNYVLRGAKLPAGNHKIVMTFAPKSYYTGETISRIASILTLLAFFGGLFWYYRKHKFEDADRLPVSEVLSAVSNKPSASTKKNVEVTINKTEVPKPVTPAPTVSKKLKKK